MKRRCRLLAIVAGMCFAAPALAQNELDRFNRQLEQIQRDTRLRADQRIPAAQRALIDYGGYTTLSFLAIDDSDQETHILRQYDLNGYVRANFDGVHEFFARARTTYRDFNSGDSFDEHGDDWVEPTLDRATYRFDLARAFSAYQGEEVKGNVVFEGGRQLVRWANGLVLSDDIDGAQVTLSYDTLALQILAGVTRSSISDFDSSRPGFDGDTNRGFYGGLLAWQVTPKHRPFVYGLVQEDYNDQDTLTLTLNEDEGAFTTKYHYSSYYIGGGSNGSLSDRLLYGVELVYEGGSGRSNSFDLDTGGGVDQTWDDIEAGAANFRLEYLLGDENNSRLSGEVILATGDTDRESTSTTVGGNKPDTTDNAFNGFGLLNTGLAFSPNISNMMLFRAGASTFPLPTSRMFRRMQVGIDGYVFNKFNRNAPIDEPTSDDTYLGIETDLYVNWEITSDLALGVRYGVFFPSSTLETDTDERHFFYTGLTFSF